MVKKKILHLTGTRADFGLMTPILKEIEKSPKLELVLYATGMHLMREFGYTFKIVKKEIPKVKKIKATIKNDNKESTIIFVSDLFNGLTKVIKREKPDIALIPCDRVEMLAFAFVCNYMEIPIAHIHGGEKTSTTDEIARHTITKLSHIHFAATNDAATRIIKMGEDPKKVYIVGAPALDTIYHTKLLSKEMLLRKLSIRSNEFILVTLHPVNGISLNVAKQIKLVLDTVLKFNKAVVVIYPNSDSGGRKMISIIEKYVKFGEIHAFKSLDHKTFLALEKFASVWVGNSSAGIIESSSFKTPVVNIGSRQNGRLRPKNVIDVDYDKDQITRAIKKSLYDKRYLTFIKKINNPWGDGKSAKRVVKVLENLEINDNLLNKQITY